MSTRVLVVDDDPLVCRAISVVLARGGFDVQNANDAAPALQIAAQWTPDIAVVDYNMPTCGLALVRELKARLGDNVFVAVLTGDDDDEMREKCHAGGADAVLIKPIAPVELRRRLTAAAVALKTLAAAS
ncbi:MAG TPA: response regulator [Kofleriaceae bacterium]|nr:response regulator [Kofleriaceae bacterium]